LIENPSRKTWKPSYEPFRAPQPSHPLPAAHPQGQKPGNRDTDREGWGTAPMRKGPTFKKTLTVRKTAKTHFVLRARAVLAHLHI